MSFSSELKAELYACPLSSQKESKAFSYGLLLFQKEFSVSSVSAFLDDRPLLLSVAKYLSRNTGVVLKVEDVSKSASRQSFCLRAEKDDAAKLSGFFGHYEDEKRIIPENIPDGCMGQFLRGAFLACGAVGNPDKSYRIEFSSPREELIQSLAELLSELFPAPRRAVRKELFLLYYKDSETVEDILTFCGAVHSSLKIMEIKVVKDVRNKINRVTNCETANISKVVNAAVALNSDIALILEKRSIEYLSEDLRELAMLRYSNPEMSIRDLGQALDPPLSRSGVSHRLKRISLAAEKLRNE